MKTKRVGEEMSEWNFANSGLTFISTVCTPFLYLSSGDYAPMNYNIKCSHTEIFDSCVLSHKPALTPITSLSERSEENFIRSISKKAF